MRIDEVQKIQSNVPSLDRSEEGVSTVFKNLEYELPEHLLLFIIWVVNLEMRKITAILAGFTGETSLPDLKVELTQRDVVLVEFPALVEVREHVVLSSFGVDPEIVIHL